MPNYDFIINVLQFVPLKIWLMSFIFECVVNTQLIALDHFCTKKLSLSSTVFKAWENRLGKIL